MGWKQHTVIGAATLLSHLAAAKNATGDPHWATPYDHFSGEKNAVRWQLLSVGHAEARRPQTLYSNQFFTSLARTEPAPARVTLLEDFMKARAQRALRTNVFDVRDWHRLDWAGDWSEDETEDALKPFGLTLASRATVIDVYAKFDPVHFETGSSRNRRVNGQLLMGIPTLAFHKALLSEDPALVQEVAPPVEDMVHKTLAYGRGYTHGENFNRTVILGLHLVALRARGIGR